MPQVSLASTYWVPALKGKKPPAEYQRAWFQPHLSDRPFEGSHTSCELLTHATRGWPNGTDILSEGPMWHPDHIAPAHLWLQAIPLPTAKVTERALPLEVPAYTPHPPPLCAVSGPRVQYFGREANTPEALYTYLSLQPVGHNDPLRLTWEFY